MPQRGYLATLVLVIAGGAFLIALSLPQLAGGVRLIAQERTRDNIAGGNYTRPLTARELSEDAASWGDAAALIDDSDTWTGLGDVLLAVADAADDEARRRQYLAAADNAYRKALARGPANAQAWAMLAVAGFEATASAEQLLPLLRMSLRTGPREPGLSFPRLDVAFYFWRQLDPALRAAIQEQALLAASFSPRRLAELVHRRYQLGPARAMLNANPLLKWRFDEMYSRLFP